MRKHLFELRLLKREGAATAPGCPATVALGVKHGSALAHAATANASNDRNRLRRIIAQHIKEHSRGELK